MRRRSGTEEAELCDATGPIITNGRSPAGGQLLTINHEFKGEAGRDKEVGGGLQSWRVALASQSWLPTVGISGHCASVSFVINVP